MHKALKGAYLSTLPYKRRTMPVSIGLLIKNYLKKEKGLGPSQIALDFQTTRQNIANQLDKVDPNMSLVRRLSTQYKVDLFQVISSELRKHNEISVINEPNVPYGKEITRAMYDQLLQENLDLHRELRERNKEMDTLRRMLDMERLRK